MPVDNRLLRRLYGRMKFGPGQGGRGRRQYYRFYGIQILLERFVGRWQMSDDRFGGAGHTRDGFGD